MATPPEPSKSPPPTASDGTVLPFPDRFHEAVKFTESPPPGAAPIADETRLVLYALHQQATAGPCREPKPWGWNVVESAKWSSWSQLGQMSSVEAMRLYVKVLEEEVQPDWWLLSRGADLQSKRASGEQQQQQQQQPGAGSTGSVGSGRRRGLRETAAVPGVWAVAEVGGEKRPAPRYEHAAVLFRRTIYVIGGNCGGRYLGDVWTLDLESLAWRQLRTTAATPQGDSPQGPAAAAAAGEGEQSAAAAPAGGFPALAGHAAVVWGSSILCVGGHTKGWQSKAPGQRLAVRVLDTASASWSLLRPEGESPPNRGSHTATLIGNRVFVFGGEDRGRRAVADLAVLDLTSLAWSAPETSGGGPSPRSSHAAVAVDDRWLLIFGGGSHAHCHSDLWALDTETLAWTLLAPEGPAPTPRAGHAGDLLGSSWYIAGGGNNAAGCGDLVALDISGLSGTPLVNTPALRWRQVAAGDAQSALASEGLSLTALPSLGLLLAFGGYSGRYHAAVQVFRPDAEQPPPAAEPAAAPRFEPLLGKKPSGGLPPPEAAPAAAAGGGTPKAAAEPSNGHLVPLTGIARAPSLTDSRAASLQAVARDAVASKEAMQSELALMRKQLNRALEAKAAAEKELEEARGQLSAEQSRGFKLEVELAEARREAGKAAELEKGLSRYRKMIEEAEKGKGKGGLWGYISGAP